MNKPPWCAQGDPRAIAAAVTRLQRDPALAARLARDGRIHVETHFNRTVMLDRMESLFLRHARARHR